MHIALIDPAVYDEDGTLVHRRRLAGQAPPVGLRLVAALTPPEHRVDILEEVFPGTLLPEKPDLVGLHLNTVNARRGYQLAAEYRRRGVPVVAGGVHASLAAEETEQHVDAVVVGEAEPHWAQVLRDVQQGTLQRRYHSTEFADVSTIPLPRYDLVPMERYYLPIMGSMVPYETARGCPNHCEFCVVPSFYGRRYRPKPIGKVVDELRQISQMYRRWEPLQFFFVDDNLCINRERSLELFKALEPLHLRFSAMLTPETAKHPEVVAAAARAGLNVAFLGLESLSQANLGQVGKTFLKVDEFAHYMDVFARHGVLVESAIIFGLEQDKEETFESTIRFLVDSNVAIGHFEPLIPLPGTRLYARFAQERKLLRPHFWLEEKYNGFQLWQHPTLDAARFERLFWDATQRFYSLGSIARRMSALPNRRHASWLLPYNLLLRSRYRAERQVR